MSSSIRRRKTSTYGSHRSSCPYNQIERFERLQIARLILEDHRVGLDGLLDILDLALVQLRNLVIVDFLLLDGAGEITLLLVNAEEVCEAPGMPVKPLQRVNRLDVLAIHVVNGPIGVQRFVDPLQILDQHSPEAKSQHDGDRHVVGRICGRDRPAVRVHDLVPAACCLGRSLHVVARPRVTRREFERGEIAIESFLRILDLSLVEGSNISVEVELRGRIVLVSQPDLDGIGEGLRIVRRRIDRDEGFGGVQVVGFQL